MTCSTPRLGSKENAADVFDFPGHGAALGISNSVPMPCLRSRRASSQTLQGETVFYDIVVDGDRVNLSLAAACFCIHALRRHWAEQKRLFDPAGPGVRVLLQCSHSQIGPGASSGQSPGSQCSGPS